MRISGILTAEVIGKTTNIVGGCNYSFLFVIETFSINLIDNSRNPKCKNQETFFGLLILLIIFICGVKIHNQD